MIECNLERPVHWFVCMLHLNELPLRHLFKKIDGITNRWYTGVIGRKLLDCENLQVKKFKPIFSENMPDGINDTILSTDQKYLYKICHAISSGYCDL